MYISGAKITAYTRGVENIIIARETMNITAKIRVTIGLKI
jgi:hypothetical protein